MQRNHRFYRDKKLLALEREDKLLCRRPTMVAIDPPIQRGWVRHWVLADWVKDHAQRAVFEDILREVNTEQLFSSPTRPRGKRRSRRQMHETSQGFKRIKAAKWRQLNWSSGHKAYFRPIYHVRHHGRLLIHYILCTHHMFELKVEPRWIRRLPLLDPESMSRRTEIGALLGKREEMRLNWLHGGRRWHRWWRSLDDSKHAALGKAARKQMVRIRQGEWDAERRQRAR
jgi:hypothetical protein